MSHEIAHTGFSPRQDILVQYTGIPAILKGVLKKPVVNHRGKPALAFNRSDFSRSFLSPGELDRLNGFKALKKQLEWLSGRYALKSLVRKVLDPEIHLDRIQIDYQDKGAPFLVCHPDLSISLSHSGEYTAAALCRSPGLTLGLDIEKLGKMPDSYFMKTAFSQREVTAMSHTAEAVFTSWTLKEAFLKYIKLGFNENLHKVEILDDIFHHGKQQELDSWTWCIDSNKDSRRPAAKDLNCSGHDGDGIYILSMVAAPAAMEG